MTKINIKENELVEFIADTLSEEFTQKDSADVKKVNKAFDNSTQMKAALKRIDQPNELPGAFKAWFQTLGYAPGDNSITINKVVQIVRQTMTELGYK